MIIDIVSTISVFFNATTYDVSENAGTVTLALVLTNPSSTDITVQVTDNEGTATSKNTNILLYTS